MLPLLQVRNLNVGFRGEDGFTQAVHDLNLTVQRGEIVAIVGESGSGKSVTSLSVLQLLPQPPAQYPGGQILFSENGKQAVDLLQANNSQLQQIRGHRISMIFQEPMTSLNPVMRCGDQITEAILLHKKGKASEAKKNALAWLAKVQLPQPESLYHRYPHQLSGGQKQRVMIAMAMCCQPALLICDEPTTALDVTVQKTILQLIQSLQREQNMGVIFITHDLGVVRDIADRVLILYRGRVVEEGPTAQIFSTPVHPYTQALIACRPVLHPKGEPLPTVASFLEKEAKNESIFIGGKGPVARTNTIPSDKPLVAVQNLVVRYPVRTNWLGRTTQFYTAVDNVSFSIAPGETLGLVGESGCGKTTLGRALLRLVAPSSGTITIGAHRLDQLSSKESGALRKDVQLVFQDPYSSLNPRLTIGDAIGEPLALHGQVKNRRQQKERIGALLEQVGLPARMMQRYPHEFSGGQRQRIVIARALAMEPQFLVCDESVSALDVSVQAQVLNLLNDLKKDLGLTLLFISHDLSVVRYMSDRIMVMRAGKIVEEGAADAVYYHPQNEYTQQLVAAIPGGGV